MYFRVILGDNNVVTAEALIIQPVNLGVDIVRNLSAAWYHKHPDVEIVGILDAFAVSTNDTFKKYQLIYLLLLPEVLTEDNFVSWLLAP